MGQFSPLQVHTDGTLFADRALVGSLHVQVVASLVQIVPTRHRHNSGRGSEQVITADWTIVVHGVWVTSVGCCAGYGDADVTTLRNAGLVQAF
jgi:hypothetical protein